MWCIIWYGWINDFWIDCGVYGFVVYGLGFSFGFVVLGYICDLFWVVIIFFFWVCVSIGYFNCFVVFFERG